jgi:hypothetical protein
MINSFSSDSDLRKVIENHNPFDRSLVVRSHDVWNQSFPDVPFINSHASNAVFQAIEQIKTGKRSVVGITITAEIGLGKSHVVSRIRHQLQKEGNSFFVYMSETDYSDLNKIYSKFLNTLASSLKQIGSQGVMQWQELATALVNELYKSNHLPEHLIKRFPGALAKSPNIIDLMTAEALKIKTNIENPYIIQAILWTLSGDRASFAINWLSGKDLAQAQADAMGLPNSSSQDRESNAFQTICEVINLIGDYRTTVISFDELESVDCNEQGFTRAQVIALFAKDLYSKVKRGVLLLNMYATTWKHHVKTLPQAEAVIKRIGEKTFDLQYLNSDDIVALVSHWLKDFYDTKNLTPPHSVYPFVEAELRGMGKEKLIVRNVLEWCAKSWRIPGEEPVILLPENKVERAFEKELAALDKTIDEYFEDSKLIAEALLFNMQALKGETVEKVQIEEVTELKLKSADKGYLHFKVIGKEEAKIVKIVVAVLQESSSRFVSAALSRLIDYKKFEMTRGCLIRSKDVKDNTKGKQYLDTLLSNQLGGEFIKLSNEDIKPLLAILFVSKACKDYEISESEITKYIIDKQIAINNYLIREILSDPSGQVPSGLVDEDILPVTPIQNLSESDDVSDMVDSLLSKIGL